jgi:two-component system, LytTR family, response regulator
MTIRALIADDEPLARLRIRELLAAEPDIQIVGEAEDGASTVAAVREHDPDLLFLDVQMPELDGFQVLEEIGYGRVAAVIFVTAFDRFALQAFETHALDYLLKPYDDERFATALRRARDHVRQRGPAALEQRVARMMEQVRQGRPLPQRLVVPTGGRAGARSLFVDVDGIDWLEAEGKYVRLHVGERTHLLRDTLAHLETVLDPARFTRIHRSIIVNVEQIAEIEPYFRGEFVVYLKNGTRLRTGRSYRGTIHALLGRGP